jgi:hypothetical protein
MPQRRMFLERRSYRMRRMMDALRFLPLIGLCLWMVPLLWPQPDILTGDGGATGLSTSVALRYLFGGWIVLVCCGWLLCARTKPKTATANQP